MKPIFLFHSKTAFRYVYYVLFWIPPQKVGHALRFAVNNVTGEKKRVKVKRGHRRVGSDFSTGSSTSQTAIKERLAATGAPAGHHRRAASDFTLNSTPINMRLPLKNIRGSHRRAGSDFSLAESYVSVAESASSTATTEDSGNNMNANNNFEASGIPNEGPIVDSLMDAIASTMSLQPPPPQGAGHARVYSGEEVNQHPLLDASLFGGANENFQFNQHPLQQGPPPPPPGPPPPMQQHQSNTVLSNNDFLTYFNPEQPLQVLPPLPQSRPPTHGRRHHHHHSLGGMEEFQPHVKPNRHYRSGSMNGLNPPLTIQFSLPQVPEGPEKEENSPAPPSSRKDSSQYMQANNNHNRSHNNHKQFDINSANQSFLSMLQEPEQPAPNNVEVDNHSVASSVASNRDFLSMIQQGGPDINASTASGNRDFLSMLQEPIYEFDVDPNAEIM